MCNICNRLCCKIANINAIFSEIINISMGKLGSCGRDLHRCVPVTDLCSVSDPLKVCTNNAPLYKLCNVHRPVIDL